MMRHILIENRNFHCNRQSWVSVTWTVLHRLIACSMVRFRRSSGMWRVSLDASSFFFILTFWFPLWFSSSVDRITMDPQYRSYMVITSAIFIFVRFVPFYVTNVDALHAFNLIDGVHWILIEQSNRSSDRFIQHYRQGHKPYFAYHAHANFDLRNANVQKATTKKANEIHGCRLHILRLRRYLYWNRCINCRVIFPNVIL